MNKTLRTMTCLLMSLLMLLAYTPGFAEETPTLTIFIEECVTIEDFETNAATMWLQEQLGCELDFIVAPTGSAAEKANILLNSGDYPDIFYRTVPSENLYGVEAGILIDLTDYIYNADMMPNLAYIREIRPDLIPQCVCTDGKIYSFPNYTECYHCQFGNKMFYNKALLESIGKEVPTTIDEFYDCLVEFKEQYPDGIPYAGCTDGAACPWAFLTNAWTYSTFNTATPGALGLRNHDGTIESIVDDEEYREALRFINKIYTEGLLYEGSFTMDGTQLKALLASETPVLFWGAGNNVSYVDGNATPELYANEKPLVPLIGPDGAQYTSFFMPSPTPGIAITTACEDIDLAIRFVDIQYSTIGYWITNEGREGIEWKWAEEGQTWVTGMPSIAYRTGAYIATLNNVKWEPRALQIQIDEIKAGVFDEATYNEENVADGGTYRAKMTADFYAPYQSEEYKTLPALKFSSDEEEELSMLSVSLENYVAESRIAFITGNLSLDTDWDAYVSGLMSMGLDTAIDLYQTAFSRSNG